MSHYSKAMQPVQLAQWAKTIATKLRQKFANTSEYPVLTYRGMSGIASATAISHYLCTSKSKDKIPYGLCYVRKYEEVSHSYSYICESSYIAENGMRHDTPPRNTNPVFVFVDDFICEGETLVECARGFREAFDRNFNLSQQTMVCLTGNAHEYVSTFNRLFTIANIPNKVNKINCTPFNDWLNAKLVWDRENGFKKWTYRMVEERMKRRDEERRAKGEFTITPTKFSPDVLSALDDLKKNCYSSVSTQGPQT